MTTLFKSIILPAKPEAVWDAARDVGALHTRLVPGFVTHCALEGDVRTVTFANGSTVREPIVSIDDERRRVAWTAVGGRASHYGAVLQVFSDPAGSRVEWTIDLLPNELAPAIGGMQDQGLAAMRRAFP